MAGTAELQEALFELHQYLSDHIAPLMVADSMEVLLRFPAEVVASEIGDWVQSQPSGPDASVADYLFHAVKKISLVGEFDLVPKEVLAQYLVDLCVEVLQHCPEGDRDLLRQNLVRLGHSSAKAVTAHVEILHRLSEKAEALSARGRGEESGQALSREVALGLRRLSLFLERLQPQGPAGASLEQRAEVVSQFMTTAAVQSTTEKELRERLALLRQVGIETASDKVFRALAQSLPGWGSLPAAGEGAEPLRGQLSAMRQIVALAEDPMEGAKRFRELVHTAIEEFNSGHLGRAVTMFELAEQLASEQKVRPGFVEAVRKGHESLDAERLRKLAERVDCRPALRTILSFFEALQPAGLLKALDGEARRERRHELLALLEVHGATGRSKVLELLRASVEGTDVHVDPFFQMNLVYLLRVIPRPEDVPVEDEVNVVMRTPGRTSPPPLVKQVIAYLTHARHEKSERALMTYLRVFENMLLQPETAVYEPQEIDVLLERTCAALARGTPRAWRALVDHGLKSEVKLGATMARLVEAGRQDLSTSKDLVDRLLAALKAELPRTLLGVTMGKKNDDKIIWLIQALSGTPLPAVREALQEIVDKHPGQKFADAASKGLAALNVAGKPAETPAGISGDLDLFGLPGLLQSLGQSQVTGVLNLLDAQGKPEATLLFESGGLRGAQLGSIRGEEAVYQLFERPFPGTFAFVSRQDIASQGPVSAPMDMLGVILEGVRRHDEFKRAAALVPDQAPLKATGTPQTPLSDESEDFTEVVWTKASSGMTAVECEGNISSDSYRVRRLLAHWVEEGALAAG